MPRFQKVIACIYARNHFLKHWYERIEAEDCGTVMLHCDCDGDGYISRDDLDKAVFTCLRNCDTIMEFNKYVISRIKGDRAYDD